MEIRWLVPLPLNWLQLLFCFFKWKAFSPFYLWWLVDPGNYLQLCAMKIFFEFSRQWQLTSSPARGFCRRVGPFSRRSPDLQGSSCRAETERAKSSVIGALLDSHSYNRTEQGGPNHQAGLYSINHIGIQPANPNLSLSQLSQIVLRHSLPPSLKASTVSFQARRSRQLILA